MAVWHGDYTHHLQFISRRQCQQDCNGVVEAGISIDDNPPLHQISIAPELALALISQGS